MSSILAPIGGAPFRLPRGRVRFCLCALAAMLAAAGAARGEQVLIFAAASTQNAVNEAIDAFSGEDQGEIIAVFAASSTLARQIENGAPAAIYLSANTLWMDHLDSLGLIEPGSRDDRLGNRLALMASPGSAAGGEITAGLALAEWLGDGRLAIGDPDHVPAGRYARAALESLGVWEQVAQRTARTLDVRAAVAMVERGEVPLGIVYASDVAVCGDCRLVALFPIDSHPPIRYPLALVAGRAGATARAFHAFLLSQTANEIFARHGFSAR